jgi:hypothetical protein
MKLEVARWKPNIEESATELWEVPETPSDRTLVALTRVMSVVDEATQLTLRVEDLDTSTAPMLHIKALQASLQQVRNTWTEDMLQDSKPLMQGLDETSLHF